MTCARAGAERNTRTAVGNRPSVMIFEQRLQKIINVVKIFLQFPKNILTPLI